jgi:hypothetical protein
VIASTERGELRRLGDAELLAVAVDERRAMVTEDVRHFAVIHLHYLSVGKRHFGIVYTSPRRFPRKHESGELLRALDEWLGLHPDDDSLRDQTYWL